MQGEFDPFDEFAARKAAIFASLSPEAQSRARYINGLNQTFAETRRYGELTGGIGRLWDNSNASLVGPSSDVRLLMLLGAAGSGKTTLLTRCLRDRPELRPYNRPDGRRIIPALCFQAPKPTTPKTTLIRAVKRYGVSVTRSTSEDALADQLKELAQEFETRLCVMDEMQQALRGTGIATIINMQDTIKCMIDDEQWCLHTIVTGLPPLADFRIGDTQLLRRSTVVELDAVNKSSIEAIRKIIRQVIKEDAAMTASPVVLTDEFIERTMHAASYQFGSSIQIPREACATAYYRGSKIVERNDFAAVYRDMTKCRADENIFEADDWRELPTPADVMAAEAETRRKRR